MLNTEHQRIADAVAKWLNLFIASTSQMGLRTKPNELFIGYNDDTIATIVLNLFQGDSTLIESMELEDAQPSNNQLSHDELVTKTIKFLLRCASADSVIRANMLKLNSQNVGINDLWKEYFENQKHSSLRDLIQQHVESTKNESSFTKNLLQITTNSNFFLAKEDIEALAKSLSAQDIENCVLQSFETQQQFEAKIKNFLARLQTTSEKSKRFLLIQCNFDDNKYYDLISCARFTICEQTKEYSEEKDNIKNGYIIFLINLDRQRSKHFVGFQVSHWSCYHIDEIDSNVDYLPSFQSLRGKSLSELIEAGLGDLSEYRDEYV